MFRVSTPELPELREQDVALRTQRAGTRIAEDFRVLHGNEYINVITYLCAHGAAQQDAMDAAQNAFKHVWQLMHEPEKWAEVENPALWVRGVAWNMWRTPPGPRRRPTDPIESAAELPDPNSNFSDVVALHASVMDALRSLHPDVRDVMLLKIDKFTYKEIAKHMTAMGRPMTEAVVGHLVSRGQDALRSLRDELLGRREGARSR
jgi:DNA-directed RNA polymerase specialized sigma24 family protein